MLPLNNGFASLGDTQRLDLASAGLADRTASALLSEAPSQVPGLHRLSCPEEAQAGPL